MERFATSELDKWVNSSNRKPLVIRGARQVGKTWLVRDLAKRHNLELIELNLERNPALSDLFAGNKPRDILTNLEAEFEIDIDPASSLLFLDEIQASPDLFAKLRWFREDMKELPLIAAGSLLEFALNNYQFSMPVGRVSYFFLEPFSFLEFLKAVGNNALSKKLAAFSPGETIPESIHEKCLEKYHDYCFVGGMPEPLREWSDTGDMDGCLKIQQDLLATFRDDFYKYGDKFDPIMLQKLFTSVAKQIGSKFVFRQVDPSMDHSSIKKGLSLLSEARVFSKIFHTSGNGLPFGAESNEKFFKMLLIDTGLVSVQTGLSSISRSHAKDIIFANKGGLAEQFAGQQIRAAQTPFSDPALFYWQRTGGRQGEIDYIIQHGARIVPVEVKSGSAGSMKSLHQFMADKKLDLAVRLDLNPPSVQKMNVKTTKGDPVSYDLLSFPLYLAERIDPLISNYLKSL